MSRRMRTGADQRALVARAQAGDRRAVEELLVETEGLARDWATRQFHVYRYAGLEYEDLVQYAILGILQAIETFDPERGTQFSTHAGWQIRAQFTIARRADPLIRLPAHVVDSPGGRERYPDPPRVVISLDEPVEGGRGDVQPLGDLLAAEGHTAAAADEPHPLWDDVLEAVACLPKHFRDIIALRFGLDDGVQRSLDECGAILGLTRQGAHHRVRNALRRLRFALKRTP